MWTKRDAFILTGNDTDEAHRATPIQASFSIWRSNSMTRSFAAEWLACSSRRELISDDPSICDIPEVPDFHDHRHDQSLLTLCCMNHCIKGLDVGNIMPLIDTQNPSDIAQLMKPDADERLCIAGRLLNALVLPIETIEALLRRSVSFGDPIPEPEFSSKQH
jgi:hypothetical protein